MRWERAVAVALFFKKSWRCVRRFFRRVLRYQYFSLDFHWENPENGGKNLKKNSAQTVSRGHFWFPVRGGFCGRRSRACVRTPDGCSFLDTAQRKRTGDFRPQLRVIFFPFAFKNLQHVPKQPPQPRRTTPRARVRNPGISNPRGRPMGGPQP